MAEHARFVLTDDANENVVADAIQVTRVGAPPPTATWTPDISVRDQYQVYARWTARPDYATNTPFTVYHEGGSATVTVNQRATNNAWYLLGTFTLAPGQNHRVEVTDVATGGPVEADAVRFVPVTNAQVARWNVSVPQTGDHRVYAKWPALPGNATAAVYTVTHAGGSTPVVVNQRVNGGQWVLLGSFPFDSSGGGYKVELADNALGTVAADAIHVVRETVASDSFSWTPAIPSLGTYDLYARWTASSGNSAAASYTVVHGAGTDVVTVNQKQNGGQWVWLGGYGFEPDAGHQVTLTAASDGAVVADAIRLVGTGPAPADIAYIHADQLGTPQKLTDATQAVVWDRVQDPFGRQVSLTAGTGVANPLRFPGQLFDAESGFHYNYFRDYDPSTGRYIQSDPIGLDGGINTFAYVGGNPIRFVDPLGLEVWLCRRPADLPFPMSEFDHQWLKTDTFESGMGAEPDEIPAQGGNSDWPYTPTQTVDHSGQSEAPNATCERVLDVDEECVDRLIEPGQPTGLFAPLNNCQTFASSVIKKCSPNYSQPVQLPPGVVW